MSTSDSTASGKSSDEIISGITNGLRERMGPHLQELIPDSVFDQIAAAEIKRYISTTLPANIRTELDKKFNTLIREALNDEELMGKFAAPVLGSSASPAGVGNYMASEMVRKFLSDNFAELMLAFLSRMAGDVVVQMRNSMPRY